MTRFTTAGGLAMASLAAGLAALLVSSGGCSGGSTAPDAGPVDAGPPDAGPVDAGPPDAGPVDAGPPSACGHPGDLGNSIGVGKYCTAQGTCPGTAPICSTINNTATTPPAMDSYFCVQTCEVGDACNVCGTDALCVCTSEGCGCVPDSCSALIPDGGRAACDAG